VPTARRSAALFVLLASAAFAVASPLALAARPTHPLLLAFGRLAIAAVILGIADARALPAAVRGLSWRQRGIIFLAGTLLAAHFACFLWGLNHTSLPAAVSLVSLEPLAVVVCAWALLRVAPSRAEQLGVLLAMLGAVVVAQGVGNGDHRLVGDLVVLAAVALFGLYLTVARALKEALPAQSYAVLVYASASLVLAAVLAATPSAFAGDGWPPPAYALGAIAALGVIPTVIGHTMVQTASRSLPPAIVALVCPGETLGGIAIGAAMLGTVPSAVEMAGAVIIVAGAVVAIVAPREGRA
jgi:drug/metabolite transporter (DMT)-like permease